MVILLLAVYFTYDLQNIISQKYHFLIDNRKLFLMNLVKRKYKIQDEIVVKSECPVSEKLGKRSRMHLINLAFL